MKQLPTAFTDGGNKGKFSSKRLITFMFAVTLVLVVIAHAFFGRPVDENIFSGLVDVLIWALGFIGSEKFAGALQGRYTNPEAALPPKTGGDDREQF